MESEWGASWEDARLRQLTAGLVATPAQRLAWLEEALLLAWRSGALADRLGKTSMDPPQFPG